jgi:hypothetical protein
MDAVDLRLVRFTLAALWLMTGAVSLGLYPLGDSLDLLSRVHLHASHALSALYLASALDILLGLLTLFHPGPLLWKAQGLLVLAYTVIISLFLPEFWLHPFGPILKNLPVLALLWLLNKYKGTRP